PASQILSDLDRHGRWYLTCLPLPPGRRWCLPLPGTSYMILSSSCYVSRSLLHVFPILIGNVTYDRRPAQVSAPEPVRAALLPDGRPHVPGDPAPGLDLGQEPHMVLGVTQGQMWDVAVVLAGVVAVALEVVHQVRLHPVQARRIHQRDQRVGPVAVVGGQEVPRPGDLEPERLVPLGPGVHHLGQVAQVTRLVL